MGKADRSAGEDQQTADPPFRGLIGFRRAVQFWFPDQNFHREQQ
jgi:hypothetical protein